MALLIQPVAGQAYGDFYLPVAAGMGCSYNPYKWMEQLNPEAGMLRMVMGLGTRAVERTPGDYPRLICLDRAQANLRTTMAERHKFSQRQVDVLDFTAGQLCTKPLEQIIELLPKWQGKMVLSHDTDAEDMLAQRHIYRKVYFADCQGLVDNLDFIHMMRDLMKMLETAYVSTGDVFKYQCIDINSGKCLKRYIDLGTGNQLSKLAWKLVYKNVLYKRQFSVLFRSIKRNSPTRAVCTLCYKKQ